MTAAGSWWVDIFSGIFDNTIEEEGNKMTGYEFSAYGKTMWIWVDTVREAMQEANRMLIWPEESKSGAWSATTETEFRWVEGNFFD